MDAAKIDGEAIIADGRPWHDAGASEAEELAAVLGAAVACLRATEAAGCDLEHTAGRLGLALSADADQFLTIAKFRALRLLVGRVFELSGLAGLDRTCRVHAESSWRMMSRRDSHLNMLRATGAVLAAAAGGADSVAVLPFDLGSDPFADRMARNVQTIARDEAALFRIGDPGAGSGAIETLTGQLAEAAWAAFRRIEAEGGLLAAVQSGAIQQRIAAAREQRLRRVACREIDIIGVNVHIDRGRPLPATVAPPEPTAPRPDAAVTADRLGPMRLAEPFEALCDRSLRLNAAGTPPTVFVAGLGADFSAAAGKAVDTLATGGLAATNAERHESPEAAGAAFRASGAAVACIAAGSDTTDAAVAALAQALKDAGAQRVLAFFASESPQRLTPPVDEIVGSRADLPEVLGKLLDCVAIAGKNRQNRHAHQNGVGAAEL
jgi:methylmalonyl-CoA mutase